MVKDFDLKLEFYEERGPRGLITRRGDMVQIAKGQRPRVIGHLRDADEIKEHIKVKIGTGCMWWRAATC